VSAQKDINQPMTLLRPRGRYIMLGVPPHQPTLAHTAVIFKCLIVSGSLVSTRDFYLGPVSCWCQHRIVVFTRKGLNWKLTEGCGVVTVLNSLYDVHHVLGLVLSGSLARSAREL
jgi:D-arabinose 1-dehydrogenase-like Zn-dependent alcohol dehydrogenase